MEKQRNRRRIICVVGPTASGKSALAVALARALGGEVISADSRQVYRRLNIGTGKITKREMLGVRHHLLDVVSFTRTFSAHEYLVRAEKAIEDISSRGKVPIICGGTGFYIDVLVGRRTLPPVAAQPALRCALRATAADELFKKLTSLDPARAATIDRNNPRRLVRALEIAEAIGKSPRPSPVRRYDTYWVGLSLPKEELRARINARLADRLRGGMVAEAQRLHKGGLSYRRMGELGLEYRSLARYVRGDISRAKLEQELSGAIWRYAKRQITYWRLNGEIHWYSPADTKKIIRDARAILTKPAS